jgi:hypothetical protein
MDGVGVGVEVLRGVGVGLGEAVAVGVGAATNGVGWSGGGVPGALAACDGAAWAMRSGAGAGLRPAIRARPTTSTRPTRATPPIASTVRDGIGTPRAAFVHPTHAGASPRA